jgi:hypothetical protein
VHHKIIEALHHKHLMRHTGYHKNLCGEGR